MEVAKNRLQALNPYITINTYNTRLTSENARDIIEPYDVVADGTDNFPTRYLVNDACVLLDKANIYASIFRFEGQVSVFNYVDKDGNRGPNYRDLFPTPPPPGMVPSCAEGGVLGVLPGIIGSLQANEVIKVITGVGDPLSGRLFLFDALSFETRILKLSKQKDREEIIELIDYEVFCGIGQAEEASGKPESVREMTVQKLRQLQEQDEEIQIIDVREPHEYGIANLGGELIPLKQIEENVNRISMDKKVVLHCRSGARSAEAIHKLEEKYGFDNLYNLKGGILAWADEIDETMAKY